jgi:hypothetical protein
MDNAYLINKYGELATVDTVATKAYFEDSRKTFYTKKSDVFTSFDIEVIHTIGEVGLNSVLVLRGENFGVLETMPVYTSGVISYVETVAFKDDFINEISIKKQSLHKSGVNLPNVTQIPAITAKARIKTAEAFKHLQFSLQGAKVPSHVFVLKYIAGIETGDLIEWGARNFEVLTIENVNERNTLLVIDCIEVI